MKKIELSCAIEVTAPTAYSTGDSIQTEVLMNQFGKWVAIEMMFKVCHEMVKEFQKNPEQTKLLKFTLTCEKLTNDD